jgi:ABC-type branched-subunit amino acid transport system ATPase component
VGKTLLTVEHDMGVVFGLADKIAVVVYGEVIAFDTPGRGAANHGCRKPIWDLRGRCTGRRKDTDHAESIQPARLLWQEPCAAWRGLRVKAGEIVALLGRNGSGRSTDGQGHHGPGRVPGLVFWKDKEILGSKPTRSPTWALAMCPESRDIFPKLTVHQNLLLGQKGGKGSALVV